MQKKTEILAPAGSWESLEAGICAGADAAYVGGSRFGARAYAKNLDEEQLLKAIDYAHLHGRKLYLTVNTLLRDEEVRELYDYLLPYYRQGLDAVIVQDIGAMQYIRRHFPELPIHISTQATVTNALGAAFFGRLGAVRVVPARELSLEEIRDMKEKTGMEIECFVHGAMCYCYSGQCLLSSMIGGRSGNRGQCAQPCRLPYSVAGKKPQDLLSLKDLCAVDLIPELVGAGIDSFKIEGRMKQPEYVYEVTRIYRKYRDLYLEKGKNGYCVSPEDRRALEGAYERRGYCTGYYMRQNGKEMISSGRPGRKPGGEKTESGEKRDYKIKEKIRGKLIISKENRVKLSMEYKEKDGGTVRAEVFGDAAQEARKAPLDKERAARQMTKTGNTEFEFEKLDLELEEDVFLPVQSLNDLRREGIAALQEKILSRYRRDLAERRIDVKGPPGGGETAALSFQVSVLDVVQLAEALKTEEADVLYVDGNIAFDENVLRVLKDFRRKDGAKRLKFYAAMPYIFRKKAISYYEAAYGKLASCYDGVLIRNWESYEWLKGKGYTGEMVSDYNLYVFNRESRLFMRQTEIREYTLPVELNLRELEGLGGGGILAAYGYQPVMVTANCIRKTALSCGRKDGILWLTDRRQKKFAVKNYCKYCYNVIYNCAPLVTADMAGQVLALRPSGIRLDFSVEDGKTTREVIRMYRDAFLWGKKAGSLNMEYTRGHLKRGVRQVEAW